MRVERFNEAKFSFYHIRNCIRSERMCNFEVDRSSAAVEVCLDMWLSAVLLLAAIFSIEGMDKVRSY